VIATGCRFAGAMTAWLHWCAEAMARACRGARRGRRGTHAGAPSRVGDEKERVYFNLDCLAASARMLVL